MHYRTKALYRNNEINFHILIDILQLFCFDGVTVSNCINDSLCFSLLLQEMGVSFISKLI